MVTPKKGLPLCTAVSVKKIHMDPRNSPIFSQNKCSILAILTATLLLPSLKKAPPASLCGGQAWNSVIPMSFPSVALRSRKDTLTLEITRESGLNYAVT